MAALAVAATPPGQQAAGVADAPTAAPASSTPTGSAAAASFSWDAIVADLNASLPNANAGAVQ